MGNTENVNEMDYRAEADYQEIVSNKFALKCLLYTFILLLLVWLLTIFGFFVISKTIMTEAFLIGAVLLLIPIVAGKVMYMGSPALKYIILVSITVCSATVAGILSYHTTLLYALPLIMACQYISPRLKWFTYGINVAAMCGSMFLGFYTGLCDLNLFFESIHNYQYYYDTVVVGGRTLALNDNVPFIIIFYATIPRALILLLYNLILQNISSRTRGDTARLALLRWKSDTDPMTGALNHGKYDDMVRDYYFKIDTIAAVYCDVNGLKIVNDTYGHAHGDKLIQMTANALLKYTGDDRCKVFRLGGDEFLLLIENPGEGEADRVVEEVYAELKAKGEGLPYPVSCSAGTAHGKGTDIVSIVKLADTRMYAYKKAIKAARE